MYYQFFVHVFLYDKYTPHAACLYSDVINIAKEYDLVIIIHSMRQVYFV